MTDQTPTTEEHATVRLGTEIQRYAEGFPRSDFSRVAEALAAHDRETAAQVLDDLTAWLADLHAKHPAYTDYVPLVLLNIERFRPYRIEAGNE